MSAELVLSSAGVLPVGACRRSSPKLGLHVRPHPKSIERSPGVVLVFFVAGLPRGRRPASLRREHPGEIGKQELAPKGKRLVVAQSQPKKAGSVCAGLGARAWA